jgi:hypothetical protein
MISYYLKESKEDDFTAIQIPVHGCWINVEDAISSDIHQISEITGIDFTSIQDALDRYEIPRVEKLSQNIVLYTRHPIEVEAGLYTMSLTIIITNHYFITISPSNNIFVKNFLMLRAFLFNYGHCPCIKLRLRRFQRSERLAMAIAVKHINHAPAFLYMARAAPCYFVAFGNVHQVIAFAKSAESFLD